MYKKYEKVIRILEKNKIEDLEEKIEKLESYKKSILEKNRSVNLTAITEKEFVKKHYLDSLIILNYIDFREYKKIVDIGTGAGFPGVPLSICLKNSDFTLVDSLKKRLNIIDKICVANKIKNVEVMHARAEEVSHDKEYRENFDLAVSRAVAELRVLSEISLPFCRVGGLFIAYKGSEVEHELRDANDTINKLGGKIERVEKNIFNDEDMGERSLVFVRKITETDIKYPRRMNRIKKNRI